MMGEVARLTAGSNGALGFDDYRRMVDALLSGGSDPVITREPVGVWTHAIADAALNRTAKGRGFPASRVTHARAAHPS